MELFPKTVSCNTYGIYGQYDADNYSIELNIPEIKKDFPKTWRRQVIETWFHELSHAIYYKLWPYSLKTKSIDFLSLYKDELVAHTVSRFIETVLLLDHQFESVEEGATASLSYVIGEVKKYYNES